MHGEKQKKGFGRAGRRSSGRGKESWPIEESCALEVKEFFMSDASMIVVGASGLGRIFGFAVFYP